MRLTEEAPTRPVMRYMGGKWMLAPHILQHLPPHQVYVEPFAGGASVLMRKPRSYAEVLNDMDGEIGNLHRVLRDPEQAAELERLLRLTPFARDEFAAAYEPTEEPVEWARRALIRSYMGFGSDSACGIWRSGFRSTCRRSGTTAAQDWANYPKQIRRFTERLQGVVIENRPALEVIAQQDGAEVLFYVDPPYPHNTRQRVRGYRFEMTDADHERLSEVLRSARGMVVLSGYRCPLYDQLYHDWRSVERPALADGAKPRVEVLWLNPAANERQGQQRLLFEEIP